MVITPVHIHLLIVHVPIVGVAFVAVMLLIGLLFKNSFLQKVSLLFLLFCTLTSVVAYLTGDDAAEVIERIQSNTHDLIEAHQQFARYASFSLWFIGGVTFLGLLLYRKRADLPRLFIIGIFVLTVINAGLFAWTGYLGGQIRHTEVRASTRVTAPALASGSPTTNFTVAALLS